ncbi:hypothetical protein CMO90_00735 [Candidatus Woesearchaeota archaeon]|nr:hypothetical protein [Candidatus Woesearchaeota archaeon]
MRKVYIKKINNNHRDKIIIMINIKKSAIIASIAILFAVFIFSFINAIYEEPNYDDFCNENPYLDKVHLPPETLNCTSTGFNDEDVTACDEQEGRLEPIYEGGCVKAYKCETCHKTYEEESDKHKFFVFVMSSILGLTAVITSIYLPYKKNSLKEWILSGFLIAGLIAIFIGTIDYFGEMHRIIKPIIILIEIILVILVAYKNIENKKKK